VADNKLYSIDKITVPKKQMKNISNLNGKAVFIVVAML
jgi:hypothetical protein